MSCKAKIFLQPVGDTLAVSIGTREISPRLAAGNHVRFEHAGRIIGGLVRSIRPTGTSAA